MILQGESVILKIKTVETIADVLPVDEVFGMQDYQSGHGVHGGACQIVIVAHTQNVGVGELIVEKGIGEGTIAIIGSP